MIKVRRCDGLSCRSVRMHAKAGATVRGLVRLMLVLASVPLVAQEAPVRFDAASIKPNVSRDGSFGVHSTNGQIRATNVPLMRLVTDAYQLQVFQIVGAPAWVTRDRFDVAARASGIETDQYRPMLRQLLAERFQLAAHTETRELPIFALVLVREGRLGPKLAVSKVDCATAERTGQFCGTDVNTGANNRAMRAASLRISDLAARLSQYVGQTVVDKTGLAGEYDLELAWTSDVTRPPLPGDSGPSIFTALQEQLGLKLDSEKGPVEVLVIDRVEQPTAD